MFFADDTEDDPAGTAANAVSVVCSVAVYALAAANGDGADFAATETTGESVSSWETFAWTAGGESGVEFRAGVRYVEVVFGLGAVGDDAAVAAIRVPGDVVEAESAAFGDVPAW